jgi:7,8-dihydropterin-6-yl-methyl-4-(beta-D-ribofuranosyl)aminobenzene 5'-phosphate synthase
LSADAYVSDSGLWAATGSIDRTTDFEKGMPAAVMEAGGEIVPDPVAEDQAVVLHLADKGLVVISGCAHAGIVNTVRHARRMTGVDRVHAVVGGFHLGGSHFEPIIEPTIAALQALDPDVVVPMHCTGRRATNRLQAVFGPKFGLSSVGTTLRL